MSVLDPMKTARANARRSLKRVKLRRRLALKLSLRRFATEARKGVLGQLADATQGADIAALHERFEPIGECRLGITLRIGQQTPGAGEPVIIKPRNVIRISWRDAAQ